MSKILVVDDEKILRNLLQFRLATKGYTIEVAENGKDYLKRRLRKNQT